MDSIFNSIESLLQGFGVVLGAIGLICLGFKAIFSFFGGKGLRDVFQGVGVVFIGLVLIGAASALASAVFNVAGRIG